MRKLRRTSLVLFAVFALTAVAASAAQAAPGFEWASGTTKIERAENTPQEFEVPGKGSFSCNEVLANAAVTGTGAASITTTKGTLTYNDTTKGEDKCPASLGTAKVTTNECQYVFNAAGTVNVVCPSGKAIEINVSSLCLIKVGSQAGISPITFDNITFNGHMAVDLTVEAHNIAWSSTGLCGAGSGTNATYTGHVVLIGTNGSGAQTDVTWHS
jgi:hypothetical protein